MKITRRTVLRLTGAAAASLALSSCSASGSAILGSNFSSWLQQTLGISSSGAASSAASSEDMVASSLAAGEQPAASLAALPAYDADPLTGEAKRSNGRIVGVMVNNISNTSRQNARPQRGLSSADLLIECKVEGGITRFCAVFHDADSIPEIGPLRSGRDQFLQLLMPYQALYYHDGESAACTKFINVYNYSGLNIGGKSYFNTPTHPHVAHRDSRGRDVAYEHTEFTSGKEIRQAASNAGIGLKYDYDATSSALRTTAPARRMPCRVQHPAGRSASPTRTTTRPASAMIRSPAPIKCRCTAASPANLKTPWTS